MSDAPRRRVSGWKVARIAAGVLFVIAVIFYFWISSVADRRWKEMEKRVAALLAETKGRETARPPVRGEAVPGNAWEDYEAAIQEAGKFKASNSALADFITKSPKADRSKVEAVLAAHSVALDHLRRGARRSDGQYPMRWEDGMNARIPGPFQSQLLANLAGCQARLLAEAGNPGEALPLLTDTAQFGRDLGTNGQLISEWIGIAVMGIAYGELRDLIGSGKLTPDHLGQLSRELEHLDRTFVQTGPVMLNEALGAGSSMLKAGSTPMEVIGRESLLPYQILGGWRYGFSARLMLVDAFDTYDASMRKFARCDAMAWPESKRMSEEQRKETEALKNPIAKLLIPGLLGAERAVRERRAQLRLLRAAAHYKRTGDALELDDPFGGKILSSRAGLKLTLWSVGRDGQDDGGTGAWKPSDGKDIVLEVER